MIDWDFIYNLEGGVRLDGYIPRGPGHSGVTVGAGFDVGQVSKPYIEAMNITAALKDKLLPYTGLTGDAARFYLNSHPLRLAQDEVNAIMDHLTDETEAYLRKLYNRASKTPFTTLPAFAQTVIMSVEWQYGEVDRKCPHFWDVVIVQDWEQAVHILNNFGDAYATRRCKEAAFMQEGMNNGAK